MYNNEIVIFQSLKGVDLHHVEVWHQKNPKTFRFIVPNPRHSDKLIHLTKGEISKGNFRLDVNHNEPTCNFVYVIHNYREIHFNDPVQHLAFIESIQDWVHTQAGLEASVQKNIWYAGIQPGAYVGITLEEREQYIRNPVIGALDLINRSTLLLTEAQKAMYPSSLSPSEAEYYKSLKRKVNPDFMKVPKHLNDDLTSRIERRRSEEEKPPCEQMFLKKGRPFLIMLGASAVISLIIYLISTL